MKRRDPATLPTRPALPAVAAADPGVFDAAAALLGPAALLAYIACSVAVALVFLCFAEVGSRVTRSGGAYARLAARTYGLDGDDRVATLSPLHFDQSTFSLYAVPLAAAWISSYSR